MDELIIFLSPGEKLKQARFELDITQEQLSCEKLSRRAISTIESGIRKLNYSTANIIVERINELQKQLRQALDYDFTVDYLMEDIETQVTKEIENIIVRLSNQKNEQICDELIKRAEVINKEYSVNPDLMIQINNLATRFYVKTSKFDNALYFTSKNIKLYLLKKDGLNSFIMQCYQSGIYINLEDYKSVIGISRILDIDDEIKKQKEFLNVCFNTALAYYFMDECKKSMEWLNCINLNEISISKKLEVINLVGANLVKQNQYKDAEEKFSFVIHEAKENGFYDLEANSYSNIAEISRLQNNDDKALEYINKALEIKIVNFNFLMNVYRNALLIYIKCNLNKDEISKCFEQALSYSTFLKRKKVQFQLLNIYLKYCCENNYEMGVKLILSLLEDSKYQDIDTGILSLTSKAYLKNDDEICKLGIKFISKNQEPIFSNISKCG